MFILKKNGKLRLMVDYRQLNEIIIKDQTLLPLIIKIKDRLQGINWFTALDLKDGYHYVRIKLGYE